MEIIKERICGCEIVSGDKEWDECRFFSDDLDDVMMFGKKRNGSRVTRLSSSLYRNNARQSTLHILLGTRQYWWYTTPHWFPNGMYTVKQDPSDDLGRIQSRNC